MGFFGDLLSFAAPIASTLLGIPQAAAKLPATAVTQTAKPAIAQLPTMASLKLREMSVVDPGAVPGGAPRAEGGSKNRTETRVLTIAPNGNIIEIKILEGSPWLMRKDFVIMKRVIRTLSRGEKRIPKKRTRNVKDQEELALMKGLVKGLIASGGHHGAGHGVTIVDT